MDPSDLWNSSICVSICSEASETPNSSEDDAHTTSEDEIRIEREVVNKKVTRSQQDSEIVKGLDEAKSEALANQEGQETDLLSVYVHYSKANKINSLDFIGWWGQFLSEDNELDRLENGSKMLILMDILKECEMLGDKVLVFSQSLLSLDLIEDFLARAGQSAATAEDSTLMSYLGTWVHGKDYFRMDGSTPPDTRKKWCNYFNKVSFWKIHRFPYIACSIAIGLTWLKGIQKWVGTKLGLGIKEMWLFMN